MCDIPLLIEEDIQNDIIKFDEEEYKILPTENGISYVLQNAPEDKPHYVIIEK